MIDKRKILLLDRKSFLLLRRRECHAVNRDRLLDSVRKVAKLQVFSTLNLCVVSEKEVMKSAIWQWKRTFIRNEERVRL